MTSSTFNVGAQVQVVESGGWEGFRGVVISRRLLPRALVDSSRYANRIRVTHIAPCASHLGYRVGDEQQWWDEHLRRYDGLLDI